ncbi:hypothetical protein ACF1AX_21225 [Streptomyces sp. NPDC014802]|uniref:Mucin n=1 Tax=Streptomyces phage Thestral TaxID=2301715 RepID=A0A385E2W2_9CAUD|nr:hypothetical protein KGG90_gp35 [Streptomyces phage Thestral]AXQ62374.1 hypothetical protein SEA_TRVXSCOTT_48 [Streptomyces phage TrvxScott]AXQ65247.1 hypothetical protein SEA_THESTRAL_51 [Streptomyces phage Thestral]QAY15707.1 hypothetical protein SEA_BOWDEN_49 [Streptomyces phage Bowden]QAY15872.1 hypothetical protein SEA_TINABELCHER_49 [Streptomyces phage TinaBelcher]
MTLALEAPVAARTRDPKLLLNALQPKLQHLTVNILDSGMSLWDREVALLLRDNTMVRDMAERILGQAVAYTVATMEHKDVHLGVGKLVDIGVHQLILDTPVYFAMCDAYNGGAYRHHAPFIQRRSDGLCIRTADFLRSDGWAVDEELWAIDGSDCSPCDNKVPDSH